MDSRSIAEPPANPSQAPSAIPLPVETRHPGGRPRKTPLTDEEFEWVATILGEGRGGAGFGATGAAHSISVARGGDRDPRLAISARWLSRQMAARGYCQGCYERGRRDFKTGRFEPGVCPKHFRGVQGPPSEAVR